MGPTLYRAAWLGQLGNVFWTGQGSTPSKPRAGEPPSSGVAASVPCWHDRFRIDVSATSRRSLSRKIGTQWVRPGGAVFCIEDYQAAPAILQPLDGESCFGEADATCIG